MPHPPDRFPGPAAEPASDTAADSGPLAAPVATQVAAPVATPAPPSASPPPVRAGGQSLSRQDVLTVLALGAAAWLAWQLAAVLLLAFAGVLVALVLRQLAQPFERRLGLRPSVALATVAIGLLLLLVGGSWLVGANIAAQLQALNETLPRAWQALQGWLAQSAPGRSALAMWQSATRDAQGLQQLAGLFTGTVNATVAAGGALVLVLAIGVYLAADPRVYVMGLLQLMPHRHRERARRTLAACGEGLSRWLLGQGASMLAVGLLTALGLGAIGMPLVLSLSVIAAILEFVPYFGPIFTAVLIIAVALTEGERMALMATLVCLAVQQLEAYVVQPVAQRWAVRLPPVMGLLAVLVFGLLFGLAGVLLAVPLMVLSMVVIRTLYADPLNGRTDRNPLR